MTPRERVLLSLEHKEPDRLAIDFAGTDCSGIHIIAYDKLRSYLHIEPRPIRIACLIQLIADCDPEIQDVLQSDVRPLYFESHQWHLWDTPWDFTAEVPALWQPRRCSDGKDVIKDPQGVIRAQRPAQGYYFDPVHFVFSHIESADQFKHYDDVFSRWDWSAVYDESVPEYARRAETIYHSTDKAVVACWRMHYVQAGQIMRGYEQFMMDLLLNEKLVREMLDRLHEAYMRRAQRFLEIMADYVDIVMFTDDLGTQNAPLMAPGVYRRLIKPYWAELIGLVKSYNKKVLMHSCGAVAEFIPDFIEMGIDAVNPVQVSAAGMSPAHLKKQFGNDIAFWGGGVNTQGTLDNAGPEQVEDEVKRHIDILAPGGGYVFTQVHNIQFNVPPENILAAYRCATEAASQRL